MITALLQRATPIAIFLAKTTGTYEFLFCRPEETEEICQNNKFSEIYIDENVDEDLTNRIMALLAQKGMGRIYFLGLKIVPLGQSKIAPGTVIPVSSSSN